jgi:hypothetical protein
MKKLLVFAMALSMSSFAIPVATHAAPQMNMSDDSKPPPMTLQGTVKADGDKLMFVNDKDGKSWEVINPETLKPHVGHHVELSAHVYADKMQIHVMSVKMMKKM